MREISVVRADSRRGTIRALNQRASREARDPRGCSYFIGTISPGSIPAVSSSRKLESFSLSALPPRPSTPYVAFRGATKLTECPAISVQALFLGVQLRDTLLSPYPLSPLFDSRCPRSAPRASSTFFKIFLFFFYIFYFLFFFFKQAHDATQPTRQKPFVQTSSFQRQPVSR